MNSIIHVVNSIAQQLQSVCNSYQHQEQYAWWILENLFQKNRLELITRFDGNLTQKQRASLDLLIEKLVVHRMPLQYILGSIPFAGTTILVEPPILIPRPETEEWVCKLIAMLTAVDLDEITVLDMATGSGCIAIALAYAFRKSTVYAVDISACALALTRKNMVQNDVTNVIPVLSDLFNNVDQSMQYDIIVGNPPYIPRCAQNTLDASVLQWEDHKALFASDDGLFFIKKIINAAPNFLRKNDTIRKKNIPQLIIEIDATQGIKAQQYMRYLGYCDVQVMQDYAGKDRVILGNVP